MLWVASALVAFLGARTFVEYLRRLNYDGPIRLWRELLLGSAALTASLWSALVIDISAQGLPFEVGYHPLKIFGSLGASLRRHGHADRCLGHPAPLVVRRSWLQPPWPP